MTTGRNVVVAWLARLYERVVDPLRKNPDSPSFRLSSPETHTTTIDGGIGWGQRPPAKLECPQCGSDLRQPYPHDDIDCVRCTAEFSADEFSTLDLQTFVCPVCGDEMEHGQRHPNAFEVPEWATCHSCRYHWEFRHSF